MRIYQITVLCVFNILCNSHLIKILCSDIDESDGVFHFLLHCPNVKECWEYWAMLWFSVTKSDLRNADHLQNNILFRIACINSITYLYYICKILYYFCKDYLIKTNMTFILT